MSSVARWVGIIGLAFVAGPRVEAPARERGLPLQRVAPDPVTAIPLPEADPTERLSSEDAEASREARAQLVQGIAGTWPDDHRRRFLVELAPAALQMGAEHCLPPSVALGQAVLESGWGRSSLAREHHNLFGMKGADVRLRTREVEAGRGIDVVAGFAAFAGPEQSLAAYARTLTEDPRYAGVLEVRTRWREVLAGLAGRWATDPHYVARVSAIIERYRLDSLDEPALAVAGRRLRCG